MGKKKGPTPEQWAKWAEARRMMEEAIRRLDVKIEQEKEREGRRLRRLRRLSLGPARSLTSAL